MSPFAPLGPFVGILGGMGPLATLDLMRKIMDATPARIDQDHVPVVAHNVAQIPDRQRYLAGSGESPLPAMQAGIARLNAIGASVIVIPCNTAHSWYEELLGHSHAPILHIADATVQALSGRAIARVGLLATQGTLAAGFYQTRLQAMGVSCLVNDSAEYETLFTPGCYAVKAGDVADGGRLLEQAGQALLARGADLLILACTEVPVGLAHIGSSLLARSVDATQALAEASVRWWQSQNT